MAPISSPFSTSPLGTAMAAALASREARSIRRYLPSPVDTASMTDFAANDYLSLSSSERLRSHFLQRLSDSADILGSGGSRLLVNGFAHAGLENRLKTFFGSEEALLFNSGYDANVAFFECVLQSGDVLVYDGKIHASVHDGVRVSRIKPGDRLSFKHNDVADLKRVLKGVRDRPMVVGSLLVAVESVYSMDGTVAPLREVCDAVEDANGYLVVDEAHATGLYGPHGKGRVSMFGLEDRVLARLCTFGKALCASGAVLLTNRLIRDYIFNYARPLIFTTGMSYTSVIAADCSFDFLENGTTQKLADRLFDNVECFLALLQPHLPGISADVLSLPGHLARMPLRDDLAPIIPLHTQYSHQLSEHLRRRGINTAVPTWPAIPKGEGRIRVCIHAGHTAEEINKLADAILEWALDTKLTCVSKL